MNIKFSIIIPTYNRAHLISLPIESIISQSYKEWELIIIDDGSSDNTQQVVENYNDDRIKYFWQKNQERSTARNNGIDKATGDWICFLDSDDRYTPNYLEMLNKNIVKDDYIIRTNMIYKDQSGQEVARTPDYDDKFSQQYFVVSTIGSALHFAFKKEVVEEFNFYPINIFEDIDFLLRLLNKYSFRNITFTGVIQTVHPERSQFTSLDIEVARKSLFRIKETLSSCNQLSTKEQNKSYNRYVFNLLHKSVEEDADTIGFLKVIKELNPKFLSRMTYYRIKKIFNGL